MAVMWFYFVPTVPLPFILHQSDPRRAISVQQ
jgi:hypothetical protein